MKNGPTVRGKLKKQRRRRFQSLPDLPTRIGVRFPGAGGEEPMFRALTAKPGQAVEIHALELQLPNSECGSRLIDDRGGEP